MNDLMHEFAYPNFEYPNTTYYSKHVRRCTFLPVRKPDIEPGTSMTVNVRVLC